MRKKDLLSRLDFGQRIAEEESAALTSYFVETENWRRLFGGDIDVVYGPKGSGKSALYSLLVSKVPELAVRRIFVVPAENPRGTPAFSGLVADPPATEREFVSLWKLYFASILSARLEDAGIDSAPSRELREYLAKEGLAKGKRTLQNVVASTFEYVKRLFRPNAVEYGVKVDPATQLPVGFTGKIIFGEPTAEQQTQGFQSVDALLALANSALLEHAGSHSAWVVLDRLDVAFVESPELEQNALRALFRVYLDMRALDNLRLKIFLRDDIWRRITQGGFREASHITRAVTINWDRASLVNLIVRRVSHNSLLMNDLGIRQAEVLDTVARQEQFFYRLFPDQVESGPNKPSTIDWMIGRTRDGTLKTAPREMIHLLNTVRARQVQRFELGQPEPSGEILFERQTFKEALAEVSSVRLTLTLYAEYPGLKSRLELLRGQKTSQTVETLAGVWKVETQVARKQADELVDIGFFERRGTLDDPQYWIPFLYRDALDLVQGSAE